METSLNPLPKRPSGLCQRDMISISMRDRTAGHGGTDWFDRAAKRIATTSCSEALDGGDPSAPGTWAVNLPMTTPSICELGITPLVIKMARTSRYSSRNMTGRSAWRAGRRRDARPCMSAPRAIHVVSLKLSRNTWLQVSGCGW